MSSFAEYTKNRKKKKEEQSIVAATFGEFTKSKLGIDFLEDDEIAPVTTTKQGGGGRRRESDETTKTTERKWFEKGAFSDGYQFGDVTKTLFGTYRDLEENVHAGVLGMGEKAVDTGAYILGGAGGLFGADNFQNDMQKFIEKDLYDEEALAQKGALGGAGLISKLIVGDNVDNYSVLGGKTDSLAQSGGQLGATVLLQAAGVPWWLTTGATSFGGEVETAFKEGATYGEAGLSGLITAGADILTEKISGGIKFGGKTLDAGLTRLLAEKISDKTIRTAAKLGLDIGGEGFEEVAAGMISNLGTSLYKEEDLQELLFSEEAVDEYIESFIGGAVLGGGVSGVNAINSKAQGRDYTTGLTDNEQKVIDKEVENRIAEREADGTKLDKKAKAEIKEEVQQELERGGIGIDTIESALGGETYDSYKSITEQEETLKREIEQLKKDPRASMQKRLQEAEAELREIEESGTKTQLKEQLSREVSELAKSDRVVESYNEQARKSQSFEADLSKYEGKQKENVQRAIDSGILNNTRRTHEFVDLVSRLSAEKGVLFDFTNNENLKKSGFAMNGKTVNGLVTSDGNIVLNIDSSKALNTVVGHEITHVLEETDLYTDLQNTIIEYSKTKGEYQARYDAIAELYKDVEGANIDKELTADLVGDYLFTDSDFVNNLSATKPNLFKKIYDEIKYLVKVAAAGSKEAKELEKVKKAFDKAFKESKPAKTTSSEVQIAEEVATITEEVTPIIEEAETVKKELTEEQKEYFKASKVRDENGNLKVMYHGTSNGGHTVFDPYGASKYGLFGVGSYFTDNKSVADSYTEKGKGKNKQIYETYLNITNPIDMDAQANPEAWKKAFPEADFPKSGTNENFYRAMEEYLSDNEYSKMEATETALDVLESMGYDGITHIGGGRFNKADDTRHQVYIAFHSEQIKNIDNASPTTNADIRYSLSEDDKIVDNKGNEVVLETSEAGTHNSLMAIHNLSADKMNGILELGGFPVPSIAIIDESNVGNLEYGDISVLLDKSSIDPANRKNEVYGSDVYSKRFPQTVQEVDTKELSKLELYLGKDLDVEGTTLENAIGKYSYDEEFANKFIEENNIEIEPVYKDVDYNYAFSKNETFRGFVIENDITFEKLLNDETLRKEFYEVCRQAAPKTFRKSTEFAEKKIELFEQSFNGEGYSSHTLSIKERLNKDFNSIKNGVEQELDPYGTQRARRSTVLNDYTEQYKEFLREKLSPVFGEKYIRNNRDLFLPSGNRRSFKQLYEPYTLDNIMKNMLGKVQDEEGFFYGAGNIRSNVSQRFKSISDIKNNANKLISSEEFKQVKEQINDKLNSLTEEASEYGGYSFDSYAEALNDVSKLKTITIENTKRIFKEYSFNMPDSMIQKSMDFLNELKNAPTEYFEAKPQRVIGFDEVQAVVIPNNTSIELKKKLSDAGFYVVEYDSNIEGDKTNKINQFDNLKFSLSNKTDNAPTGNYNVYGKDIALDIAPVQETVTETPVQETVAEALTQDLADDYAPLTEEQANERDALQGDRTYSLTENDMPDEVEAPIYDEALQNVAPESPFDEKDIQEVGNRKVKAYMYENPEVKPYFQEEAQNMLYELQNSVKGERVVDAQLLYETGGELGVWGTKRETSEHIAYMLDRFKYTYADIEKGLKAIIEDRGAENNAISKRLEFMIDERLREGYADFLSGYEIPANQDYINLLTEKQINSYSDEAYNQWLETLAQEYAAQDIAPTKEYEAIKPGPEKLSALEEQWAKNKMARVDSKVKAKPEFDAIAEVLDTEPVTENDRNKRKWAIFRANVLDKGTPFEDLSLKTKNRELMGKWDYTLTSEARAQNLIGKGDAEAGVKSLNDIIAEVSNTGLTKQFYEYLYHKLNIDRMTLEERYGEKNKPVFGDRVTAQASQEIVNQYEFAQPEFMDYAQDVYNYNNHLRQQLVDKGVISQETADLWADMYPHYVPIRRVDSKGLNINVPLDTGRTGVNAPIKKATGGSSDILPLFDTMASRTLQTYKATARNSFGVELKNTLGTTIEKGNTNIDEVIESVETQEELLQEGKNGRMPTFTVFENGERVTFEITKDMYDALKPLTDSSMLSKTVKPLNVASNIHRGVLTEYNPVFMLTNGIKDVQDILINSQHPLRTYAKVPEAYAQVLTKGYWYNEYMKNGGEQNSFFDSETNTFDTERKGLAKILDVPPLSTISKLNNFIEMTPRLAEYIASREAGRSIEVSMLDAARVTTNFKAGGNLTKFLNRNGATFLNASVQGAMQQVRNVREAKANGLKGWANLATKFAVAGLPAFLLNALLWDDDEEYEELSDYVKQNYYIVGKYDDGKFIRIPKGRTVAVIQDAIEQVSNLATGNDETDLKSFLNLVVTNLAPANPIENNILAPIIQAYNNETWYGDDLVPTRLQDLPAAEQYDESTDVFSKWLGETLNVSPVKINYLLDQYSGGVGDVLLPMLTPEAESGDNSFMGNMIAPLKKKFTVDSEMNNQNVSDFYDKKDELTTNAKMSTATDEDVLRNKYMNSINGELSDLYKLKREIQNSNLSDKEKYEKVREVQKQIVDLTEKGLNTYESVNIEGDYATVGDRHYRKTEAGEWMKITDEQLEKQEEVTGGLNISASEYWSNKKEYDYAYESPEKFAIAKALGGYDTYKAYTSALYDIKADKDSEGKSIAGSRKEKVINYINNLNADYYEKILLFKSEYPADDTYNSEIIEYLNNRDDISYSEMETILKELGFTVEADGTVRW